MSIATDRRTVMVYCGGCRRPRLVSPERATRIDRGVVSDLCRSCKNLRPNGQRCVARVGDAAMRADFTDADLRWWINRFGGEVPRNVEALPWIREHGMPDELYEIAASLGKPRRSA